METKIFLALLLLRFAAICSSKCQPNSQITDLWSGTTNFALPSIENNTMSYSFQSYTLATPRSYDSNSNLQYSFAMNSFSVETANIRYFDLLVLKTYQSSLVINFIYEPNKWKKVTYNYWIAFRKDLSMFIETYSNQQFSSNTDQKYQVITSLVKPYKEGQGIALAYVLGVRYIKEEGEEKKHLLSFRINSQKVNGNQLEISFGTESQLQIQSITLSFVVFEPSQMTFASYGGTIAENNLQGTFSQNLHYIFPNYHSYTLFGLSALTSSENAQDSITFQTFFSSYYDFSGSVQEWELLKSLEVTYLVAGVLPGQICKEVEQCKKEGLTYIHEKECVSICPASSRVVKYIDGAVECQECPQNQLFSYITGQCECRQGYSRNRTGQCEKRALPLAVTHAKTGNEDTLDGPVLGSPAVSPEKCLQLDTIQQSNKNIFVTLRASPFVSSDRHSQQSGFIRISFPSGKGANSYYCNQCPQDGSLYECLLLFASGVPKDLFSMLFECSIESDSGKTNVCTLQVPYLSAP